MENLMSIKEAAEFLEISEERLQELAAHRLIPAYLIGGDLLRFKKEELDVLKDLAKAKEDIEERAFHQAYSRLNGLEKVKELLRANDVYLFVVLIIILILGLMFIKK